MVQSDKVSGVCVEGVWSASRGRLSERGLVVYGRKVGADLKVEVRIGHDMNRAQLLHFSRFQKHAPVYIEQGPHMHQWFLILGTSFNNIKSNKSIIEQWHGAHSQIL